jgi:hypothetical protein
MATVILPPAALMLVALVAAPASAQIAQETQGDPEHFGPGFIALAESRVDFQLTKPAHVVLFWVRADGRVDLHYPVRSKDRTLRRAGTHAIDVADVPSPIQPPVISGAPLSGRAGQFTPAHILTAAPREADTTVSGYWVLFMTDTTITAVDVQQRLEPMPRDGGGLAVIDRLAPYLVQENAPWALYIAPVIVH